MVDEESINLGVNATPQFIGSLMEFVWAQIGMEDLSIRPQGTLGQANT